MKGFGEKIKELRNEQGYSQKKLAEKLGVTQACITYWENNTKEPSISSLKKLCEIFGVRADYLIGLTDGY